jgi:hypothetical protein
LKISLDIRSTSGYTELRWFEAESSTSKERRQHPMRTETGTVDITLGNQKFDTNYEKKIYENIEDVIREASENEKNALNIVKKLNMAEDWERRTNARNEYLKNDDVAATAASVEAQVKAYMKAREKAKKPVTEAEARRKVAAMMED